MEHKKGRLNRPFCLNSEERLLRLSHHMVDGRFDFIIRERHVAALGRHDIRLPRQALDGIGIKRFVTLRNRGAQAAASPTRGAPAIPAAWQAMQAL